MKAVKTTRLPELGASKMKSRTKFLLTCMTGAIVICAGPMGSPSRAADQAMPVKAMPAAEPVPYWWFSGDIEVGGRFFVNNPTKNGIASQGQKSLGKYYEYSTIKPGPFSQWLARDWHQQWVSINSICGPTISDTAISATKSAGLKLAKYYFTRIWDQTPHVYSTNAQTMYSGLGTGALTLPPGLSNIIVQCGRVRACSWPAADRLHQWQSGEPPPQSGTSSTTTYTSRTLASGATPLRPRSAGRRPMPGTSTSSIRTCTARARRWKASSSLRARQASRPSAEAGR